MEINTIDISTTLGCLVKFIQDLKIKDFAFYYLLFYIMISTLGRILERDYQGHIKVTPNLAIGMVFTLALGFISAQTAEFLGGYEFKVVLTLNLLVLLLVILIARKLYMVLILQGYQFIMNRKAERFIRAKQEKWVPKKAYIKKFSESLYSGQKPELDTLAINVIVSIVMLFQLWFLNRFLVLPLLLVVIYWNKPRFAIYKETLDRAKSTQENYLINTAGSEPS